MRKRLLPVEALLTFFFLIMIISLYIVAKATSFRDLYALRERAREKILIQVSGCVKRPGLYELDRGATLGCLLKKLEVSPSADLTQLNESELLKDRQLIEVPRKSLKEKKGRKPRKK